MSREIDRRTKLRLGALGLAAPAALSVGTPSPALARTTGTARTSRNAVATLEDLTVTTSTAANSAKFIFNLVVKDVTVGGVPVTAPSSPEPTLFFPQAHPIFPQAHPRRRE